MNTQGGQWEVGRLIVSLVLMTAVVVGAYLYLM